MTVETFAEQKIDGETYRLAPAGGEWSTLERAGGFRIKLYSHWHTPTDAAIWGEDGRIRVVVSGVHVKDDSTAEFTWLVAPDGKIVLDDDQRATFVRGGRVYTLVASGAESLELCARGGTAAPWRTTLSTSYHNPGAPAVRDEGPHLRADAEGIHVKDDRLTRFTWILAHDGKVVSTSST